MNIKNYIMKKKSGWTRNSIDWLWNFLHDVPLRNKLRAGIEGAADNAIISLPMNSIKLTAGDINTIENNLWRKNLYRDLLLLGTGAAVVTPIAKGGINVNYTSTNTSPTTQMVADSPAIATSQQDLSKNIVVVNPESNIMQQYSSTVPIGMTLGGLTGAVIGTNYENPLLGTLIGTGIGGGLGALSTYINKNY